MKQQEDAIPINLHPFTHETYYNMKRIIDWFKESNRWKHLIGGIGVGVLSNDWYCAALAGVGVAGALEFKDWQWGGKPDWIDFTLTVGGTAIGFGLRTLIELL